MSHNTLPMSKEKIQKLLPPTIFFFVALHIIALVGC
jgi:hypothetical protein